MYCICFSSVTFLWSMPADRHFSLSSLPVLFCLYITVRCFVFYTAPKVVVCRSLDFGIFDVCVCACVCVCVLHKYL